jgi:hypothetical protein
MVTVRTAAHLCARVVYSAAASLWGSNPRPSLMLGTSGSHLVSECQVFPPRSGD